MSIVFIIVWAAVILYALQLAASLPARGIIPHVKQRIVDLYSFLSVKAIALWAKITKS